MNRLVRRTTVKQLTTWNFSNVRFCVRLLFLLILIFFFFFFFFIAIIVVAVAFVQLQKKLISFCFIFLCWSEVKLKFDKGYEISGLLF